MAKNTGPGLFLAGEILSITGITIAKTGEPGKGARFEMTVPKDAYRPANVRENSLLKNKMICFDNLLRV